MAGGEFLHLGGPAGLLAKTLSAGDGGGGGWTGWSFSSYSYTVVTGPIDRYGGRQQRHGDPQRHPRDGRFGFAGDADRHGVGELLVGPADLFLCRLVVVAGDAGGAVAGDVYPPGVYGPATPGGLLGRRARH